MRVLCSIQPGAGRFTQMIRFARVPEDARHDVTFRDVGGTRAGAGERVG